jgi:hypothetical protein
MFLAAEMEPLIVVKLDAKTPWSILLYGPLEEVRLTCVYAYQFPSVVYETWFSCPTMRNLI